MSQIYLSESQRVALELAHDNFGTDGTIDKHCLFQKNGVMWEGHYEPLNDIPMSDLAKAFYLGYKVKPKFKNGDWVVTKDGYIGEIEFTNEIDRWANIGYSKETEERGVCLARTYSIDDIERLAIPEEIQQEKERRWWRKHDRSVWELKQGDMLINSDGIAYEVTKVPSGANHCFIDNVFYGYERIKESLKVVCFVENRLDN